MGTLFEQPLREPRIEKPSPVDIIEKANWIIEEYGGGVSFEQAMAAIAEARKQKLSESLILDLDIKDEQLKGFGELVQELIGVLRLRE